MNDPERPSDRGSVTERHWAPQIGLVVLGWVAVGSAGGWLLFTTDRGGRLFAAITLLGVLAVTLAGTLARPRLAAGPDGITVRGVRGARHWPWPGVQRVGVVRTRRLGRDVAALEIDVRPVTEPDAEDQLLLFTRLDLGAEPDDVADALTALRPANGNGD